MMFWYGSGMSGWGYALMTLSMVVFWGLLVLAVIALIQYLARGGWSGAAQGSQRPAPEDLLAERFARGEIDEHDFRQRLDILHSGVRPPAST
ncbi:MAG: SHOCT domain-containing protein [Pseudonocardiaceae bacterium]